MAENELHILSAFDRDLEALQAHFLKLSGLTEQAMTDAAKALENLDVTAADRVIAADKAIDELEEFIQMEAASLIALELGTTKVAHVRDILASGRDQLAPVTTTEWTSPEHANVRGPRHYQ